MIPIEADTTQEGTITGEQVQATALKEGEGTVGGIGEKGDEIIGTHIGEEGSLRALPLVHIVQGRDESYLT